MVLPIDERVAVEFDERRREHRTHELPDARSQRAVATRQRVGELATHPIRAECLGAGDASGIQHECCAQPCGELRDAPEWIRVFERPLELGLGDPIRMLGLMAPGVADGLLAFGVGPAGAVGDQLAVLADEQAADDLPERLQLSLGGLSSPARMSCPRPRLLRVASPCRARACARRCSSAAAASRNSSSSRRAPAK